MWGRLYQKRLKVWSFYQTNLTEASDIQKNEEIVLMNPYFGVEGGQYYFTVLRDDIRNDDDDQDN